MSTIRECAFDWLFNASVEIGLFAIFAAALSPFIAKIKARYQHYFYLAVFALYLTIPAVNTFWHSRADLAGQRSQRQATQGIEQPAHFFWKWDAHSAAHERIGLSPSAKTALLLIWAALFLYHSIRFGRGVYRVYRLSRDAFQVSSSEIRMACSKIEDKYQVALLESASIDAPVVVGVFHPAIILPSKVLSALDEADLTAILAHEYGHIRRKDVLVHLLCQVIALPMAWHPGIRYLMSRISQTRELACDEYAVVRLGKRTAYARTLLRLASLCLQVRRSNAMGLGIFDGDNLEDRIMTLTKKKTSLSRAGLIGLALTTCLLFGSGTVLARAVSLHGTSASSDTSQRFAGTWHFMFHGRSFATMILVQNGAEFTGSVTGSKIALDDAGELSKADPSDNSTPSPITKAKLEGNALHVTVMDDNQPFEFLVTLKDATHAEIHPIGAPPNMKPIQAEKVE